MQPDDRSPAPGEGQRVALGSRWRHHSEPGVAAPDEGDGLRDRVSENARGGFLRVPAAGGARRFHVSAHSRAPTFTFDVVTEGEQAVQITTNLTRVELAEHVRLCQKALEVEGDGRDAREALLRERFRRVIDNLSTLVGELAPRTRRVEDIRAAVREGQALVYPVEIDIDDQVEAAARAIAASAFPDGDDCFETYDYAVARRDEMGEENFADEAGAGEEDREHYRHMARAALLAIPPSSASKGDGSGLTPAVSTLKAAYEASRQPRFRAAMVAAVGVLEDPPREIGDVLAPAAPDETTTDAEPECNYCDDLEVIDSDGLVPCPRCWPGTYMVPIPDPLPSQAEFVQLVTGRPGDPIKPAPGETTTEEDR